MNVVIIGAGPAGLFAAREFVLAGIKPVIIDQSRHVGGSGLKSDGKLNFSYKEVGIEDLTQFISEEEAIEIIDNLKSFFVSYGISSSLIRQDLLTEFTSLCKVYDLEYIPVEQAHIGSDNLVRIMKSFREYLESLGVEFILGTEVIDVNGSFITTEMGRIPYDKLIVAVGRTGSLKFKSIYDRLEIDYRFGSIDIGVRVEFPAEALSTVVEKYGVWDAKLITRSTRRGDKVRTFCTCPYGFVRLENYGLFDGYSLVGVNGYSDMEIRSPNSNVAVLTTVSLTEPFEDTTLLGQLSAYKTNLLGGGKPIGQRYIDFLNDQRTNWKRMTDSKLSPTLPYSMFVLGDITFAYDGKVVDNLKSGLRKISGVIPFPFESTMLYAPEIKFYARKMELDRDFMSSVRNIYIVGDGSGISRGIIGAAATGIIAARGIMNV